MENLIFRAGVKVEVFFEEESLRDIWFPATILEYLGNDLYLVEYSRPGINGDSKFLRDTVDRLHIRPSVPQFKVTNFGLLDKVDAFVDFCWRSGVVTKKLADSRYLVYFKHANNAKEFGHLDLRLHLEWKNEKWYTPYQDIVNSDDEHEELREIVSLNSTKAIEDKTTTCIDKEDVIVPSMRKLNPRNIRSNTKPSKKSKAEIISDDASLPNGGQSEEISNPTDGQAPVKAVNASSEKKKRGKRNVVVELKQPKITSTRKKGKLSVDSKVQEVSPEATGDSTPKNASDVVEKSNVTDSCPIPVIVGLQCKSVTVAGSKKSKQSTPKSPQNVVETEANESGVLLTPKATSNQEQTETDGGTVTKRKRGRPFKTQPKNTETSINHQNGSGKELTLPPQQYDKPVKGRRGKRRMISLNITSSPQDVQDSSKQIENGSLEANVETSSHDAVSDDQPLSRWILDKHSSATLESTGKKPPENNKVVPAVKDGDGQTLTFDNPPENANSEPALTDVDGQTLTTENPPENATSVPAVTNTDGQTLTIETPPENAISLPAVTNGDGQTLSFKKRSSLWETIEATEAFRSIPQKPHFRPLDNIKGIKESARERQAIDKMVDFCSVYEATRRLRATHPRTEIEELLDTLLELETHGFDINFLRNRLTEMISIKDKQGGLESRSKEAKDSFLKGSVEGQQLDKEMASIDKQVKSLLERRDQVLKQKEKKDSEIVGLKDEVDKIEESMREYSCKFDELATASFV